MLQIRPYKAEIVTLLDEAVTSGKPVHLRTRGARSPLDPGATSVYMTFGQQPTTGILTVDQASVETVTVERAPQLKGTAVTVTVRSSQGSESEPIILPVL